MALIAVVLLVVQFVGAGHGAARYEGLTPHVRIAAQFCAVDRDLGHAPRPHDPAACPDDCCLIGGASPVSAVLPGPGSAWPTAPADSLRRAPGSNERPTRIAGWASTWSASGPPF